VKQERPLKKYAARILMILGIKKAKKTDFEIQASNVWKRTGEQADHAFSEDLGVQTLGLIFAAGGKWTYREYNRAEHWRRSAYVNPAVVPGRPRDFAAASQCFTNGYVELDTEASDRAFDAVRKRMFELDASLL
jgi:hypothetical protein